MGRMLLSTYSECFSLFASIALSPCCFTSYGLKASKAKGPTPPPLSPRTTKGLGAGGRSQECLVASLGFEEPGLFQDLAEPLVEAGARDRASEPVGDGRLAALDALARLGESRHDCGLLRPALAAVERDKRGLQDLTLTLGLGATLVAAKAGTQGALGTLLASAARLNATVAVDADGLDPLGFLLGRLAQFHKASDDLLEARRSESGNVLAGQLGADLLRAEHGGESRRVGLGDRVLGLARLPGLPGLGAGLRLDGRLGRAGGCGGGFGSLWGLQFVSDAHCLLLLAGGFVVVLAARRFVFYGSLRFLSIHTKETFLVYVAVFSSLIALSPLPAKRVGGVEH
jgi:hypothetical protein